MLSILFFIGLFVGICLFVVYAIAAFNIFTKSYRPGGTTLVIAGTGILFVICGLFALASLNDALAALDSLELTDTPTLPTTPNSGEGVNF